MIFKFGKIEIWRTFLVSVPIHPAIPVHPAIPIHPDLWYLPIAFVCSQLVNVHVHVCVRHQYSGASNQFTMGPDMLLVKD